MKCLTKFIPSKKEFWKKWKQNKFENFPFWLAKSGQNISKRGNSRIDWIWLNCPIHNIWRLFVMEAVSDLFIQPLFSYPPDSNYFWQKSVNHKQSISFAIYGKYDSGFGNYFSVHRPPASWNWFSIGSVELLNPEGKTVRNHRRSRALNLKCDVRI